MWNSSEVDRNTTHSPCANSSAVLNVFDKIDPFGNALTTKSDYSIRLFFDNSDGIPSEMGCFRNSWKNSSLKHTWNRFQADIMCLVETQIN